MMATCPYCKSEISDSLVPVRLSKKRSAVYHTILKAGPDGFPADQLLMNLFGGCSPTTARTCIYQINRQIAPKKIALKGGRYHIE